MFKKKLLIVSCVFPPEPVVSSKLSLDIANELSQFFNVKIISPKPSRPNGFNFKLLKTKNYSKFELLRLNSFVYPKKGLIGRIIESISFGIVSVKYIRKNFQEIDLVYLNTWPIFSQFFVIAFCKIKGIPVINHVQDIYPESFSNRFKKLGLLFNKLIFFIDKFILKKSDHVIVISKKMKNYLVKTRNLENFNVHIIRNWIDEKKFKKYNKIRSKKNDEITIMYLGNIGPASGLNFFLNIFSKESFEKIKLIIAGSGSIKNQLIKEYSGNENISFLSVPDGLVEKTQSLADILLLPMIKGGASFSVPSKAIYYMFSAKPIFSVVEKNSETAKTILNSNSGWVVGHDKFSIVEKLKYIDSCEMKEFQILGNNALNFAKNNYSKEININKINNLFKNYS